MAGAEYQSPRHGGSTKPPGGEIILILGFAFGALAFHLLVNAFGGYGIFRDEFYYVACSQRLATGYVDHPPLAMFLLAVSRAIFGVSQVGIRVLPALSHALTIILGGLIVRKLGGRQTAVILACLAVTLAPMIIGHANIFQMNAFSYLFWALSAFLIVLIVDNSRPGLWLLLGVVMGLGLLNKIDFLWFGVGFAAALLLTDLRKHLATPWPYAAAGIALLIFSPYILWNITHDFAHLEFIRNASAQKYGGLTRLDFLAGQAMNLNPVNMLIWVPGLFYLLFGRQGRRYRALGIIYAAAFAVLVANPHSKAEYLGSAYTMLFAAGGVAIERWVSRGKRRGGAVVSLAALSALSSLIILPLAVPVLPVETFIKYQAAIGMKPTTAEDMELSELPQFYADMFGWEELAREVSAVYMSLPESERAATVVLTRNYGEAASLEYYAAKYPLPRVICRHNSYWYWGYPEDGVQTIIVLRGTLEDHQESCDEVTLAAVHTCRYCMPYENNMPIFICRHLRVTLAEIWQAEKHFI